MAGTRTLGVLGAGGYKGLNRVGWWIDGWMERSGVKKKRIIFSCWAKHNKAVSMNKLSQMSICLIASSANSMPSVTRRSVMLTQVPSKLE